MAFSTTQQDIIRKQQEQIAAAKKKTTPKKVEAAAYQKNPNGTTYFDTRIGIEKPTEKVLKLGNQSYQKNPDGSIFFDQRTGPVSQPKKTVPTETPDAPVYEQQTTEVQDVFAPPKNSDGSYDQNYVPKDIDEVSSVTDSYLRNKYLANYYKSKGYDVPAGEFQGTFEDTLKVFGDQQKEDKSLLEQQVGEQKNLSKKRLEEEQSAVQANMAQDREGAFSIGNVAAQGDIELAMRSQYDSGVKQLDQKVKELQRLQTEQSKQFIAGRDDEIMRMKADIANAMAAQEEAEAKKQSESRDMLKMLQESGALGVADADTIAYIEQGFPGAPPGVVQLMAAAARQKNATEKTKEKFTNLTSGINTLKTLADSGVVLDDKGLLEMAKTTGIPAEVLLGFNATAETIKNDKTLDQAGKQAALQKALMEVDRQSRGILNGDLEKVDYIANLYRSGASQEEISETKRIMGIPDDQDPMYQADLALKQADLAYKNSQTAENLEAVKKAQREIQSLQGGTSGGYIPTASLEGITSRFEGNKLVIDSTKPMQCGEFVNRFWGLSAGGTGGMGSSITDKTNLISRSGGYMKNQLNNSNFTQLVVPGMAFVSKVGKTGHTGVVTAVYPDGTFDTMEANVGDNNPNVGDPPLPRTRRLQDADLVGFAKPPAGKVQQIGSSKSESDQMAADIMASGGTFSLTDIEQKKRPEVAKALNKIRAEALKTGDLYGMVAASAAGKDLDATTITKLQNLQTVNDQFNSFANDIENSFTDPILGQLKQLNPYDTDVSKLRAKLITLIPGLARGVYGEVGVLTDNDIKNYMQSLPNLTTTKEAVNELVRISKDNIKNSLVTTLKSQAAAGRNVAGYSYLLENLGIPRKEEALSNFVTKAGQLFNKNYQAPAGLSLAPAPSGETSNDWASLSLPEDMVTNDDQSNDYSYLDDQI